MFIFRSTPGTRRVILLLFTLLLLALFLLPAQSRGMLQQLGRPLSYVAALPLEGLSAVSQGVEAVWEGYIALRDVRADNERLHREIDLLRGQNTALREVAVAQQRLTTLLDFRDRVPYLTVAAQVIGRDSTNWYRSVLLDKGERDGIRTEMGVITPAGVVGRVVKTTPFTSIVLLITDSNNAVTGLIQRTRDEGIIEGTAEGLARMKYVPLLSTVQEGDAVVTSGLTGGFPKGLAIGVVIRIMKAEGELFQSAELVTEVDMSKLEELLVITAVPKEDPSPPPPPVSGPPVPVKAGVR